MYSSNVLKGVISEFVAYVPKDAGCQNEWLGLLNFHC